MSVDGSTLTRSRIKKLGSELRRIDRPSPNQLLLLQQLRALHDPPLAEVAVALSELGYHPATRLKTVETIIEKLRRGKGGLDAMQDIAGARLVEDCNIGEQDEVAKAVIERFNGGKLIDRREASSYGYRALHVVVRLETRYVEVQIRTTMQDLWAQIMERLGDAWGRDIRYGGEPEEPDHTVAEGLTRLSLVALVQSLSTGIAMIESWPAKLGPPGRDLAATIDMLTREVKRGGKTYAAKVHQQRLLKIARSELKTLKAEGLEQREVTLRILEAVGQIDV